MIIIFLLRSNNDVTTHEQPLYLDLFTIILCRPPSISVLLLFQGTCWEFSLTFWARVAISVQCEITQWILRWSAPYVAFKEAAHEMVCLSESRRGLNCLGAICARRYSQALYKIIYKNYSQIKNENENHKPNSNHIYIEMKRKIQHNQR